MKLVKVFDDDELNPKSGWAYLEKGHLILKDDFAGLYAGSRLIVTNKHTIKRQATYELNQLLKAERNQLKIFKNVTE